jgi:hypothetical protein
VLLGEEDTMRLKIDRTIANRAASRVERMRILLAYTCETEAVIAGVYPINPEIR